MARTTSLVLSALAAGAVLVGGTGTAVADEKPGIVAAEKPAAGYTAPLAPHPQFFGPFVTVPPGQNLPATAACPSGQVPTGGGGTTTAFRIFFTDSLATGNVWVVRGTNTNTVNESIRAFVVCTTP
ncbi:hypothetical protein SAMN05421505_15017 [Sinosporangium album]|uniref:Secreted protein n=1 Tax=Sinosporangium album TaxID=504805 RepID=A0A1G8KF79_9ACTN|nr:hypothetical protein [Sinosporangium album]SDI42075.1 hypothetical protein SAMN05421505_15017 [Sinosporangium album]